MARGFLAELNRQMKIAAREEARRERENERARKAAIREAERARKAEARAAKQLDRAQQADQKRLEKEAREAHVAAKEAEVRQRNLELKQQDDDLDSLLNATLDVDDYVDLDSLRRVAEHPPFDRTDLETPTPPPPPIEDAPEPKLITPPMPTGLSKLFGKKKYEKALAAATERHAKTIAKWMKSLEQNKEQRTKAKSEHAELERQREAKLETERSRYGKECAQREADVEEHNRAIDTLKTNLSYGAVEAVQEYVSIVLSNSVYPEHFSVGHKFEFDAGSAELRLRVLIPGPDEIPTTKAFKYTKASDEITEATLSMKACKDRYASAVQQVALRSIHEVFEADRRGVIKMISLEVGTETINPATGREAYIPFVATGAERESFLAIDLSQVVPSATLNHLGAAVSKNPFELVPADVSGIRKS